MAGMYSSNRLRKMISVEMRAQLLANCKCLYGPETEVICLCYGQSDSSYQAVAIKPDHVTGYWTRFLYSKLESRSREHAMLSLLCETETELAKMFSTNRISLPLSGNPMETMNLSIRMERHSENKSSASSTNSEDSKFEIIPTPQSSPLTEHFGEDARSGIVETILAESRSHNGDIVGEKDNNVVCEDEAPGGLSEPVCEVPNVTDPNFWGPSGTWGSWDFSKKDNNKNKDESTCDEVVVLEEPLDIQHIPENPPVEERTTLESQPEASKSDDDWWSRGNLGTKKDKKKKKGQSVLNEGSFPEEPLDVQLALESPQVEEFAAPEPQPEISKLYVDWGNCGASKKVKKTKKRTVVDESHQVDEEPCELAVHFSETPPVVDVLEVTGTKLEPSPKEPSTEILPGPATQSAEEDPWGFSAKKDKKKKKKKEAKSVVEEIPDIIEPVSEPAIEDDLWGSFSAKKDKKKKAKSPFEETAEVDEPVSERAIEDEQWGSYASIHRKSKARLTTDEVITAEGPITEPKPAAYDDEWDLFSKKKDKKKARLTAEEVVKVEEPITEPNLTHNIDDWSFSFLNSSKKKKKKAKEVVEDVHCSEEPAPKLPIETNGWGFSSKKNKILMEAVPEPEPVLEAAIEAAVEDDLWATPFKKKNKKPVAAIPEPELALELAAEDDLWGFSSKKDKKKGNLSQPEQSQIEEQVSEPIAKAESAPESPVVGNKPLLPSKPTVFDDEDPWHAKFPLDQSRSPRTAPRNPVVEELFPAMSASTSAAPETLPEDATARLSSKVNVKQTTVMLKILYTSKKGEEIFYTIRALAEDTYDAILDAAGSFLDYKIKPKLINPQRLLYIKSGAGKNGDIEVSALGEEEWSECLEYFRRCTGIPELTIFAKDFGH